jgi:hypothetical protein
MNEAAASPGSGTTQDPAPPGVVLPNLRWALAEAALVVALGTAFFVLPTAPGHWASIHRIASIAAFGLLIGAVITSTFRYEVRAGQLAVTEMHRVRQTVDLTRLASVTAPSRREPLWARLTGQQRWLELRDEQAHTARVFFYPASRRQRQRMLAALAPWVMADGVSRTGLVREALDGQLW